MKFLAKMGTAGRILRRCASSFLPLVLVLSSLTAISVVSAPSAMAALSDANCTPTVSGVTASGVASGDNCIIKFTAGSGTWTMPAGVTSIRYLVVAGGGAGGAAGGNDGSGGGGAGGVLAGTFTPATSSYTVTVGAGGASSSASAASHNPASFNGSNSSIAGASLTTISAIGGGSASSESSVTRTASNGGSGGGAGGYSGTRGLGTSGQGNNGGSATGPGDGGGGGAGAPGGNGNSTNGGTAIRAGGIGVSNDITGVATYYGGGGGAGGDARNINGAAGGAGGSGGGGNGAAATSGSAPTNGTANTGGGGGGAAGTAQVGSVKPTGAGGSGIVIISYAMTTPGAPTSLSATVVSTQASLTWTAPTSNGGSVITDYLVEYSTTGIDYVTFADGTSATTGATVTGLVSGSGYKFRVSAINAVGTGTSATFLSNCSVTSTSSAAYTYQAFKNLGICNWNVPAGISGIDYMLVAGGGGGGSRHTGGGGAGGYIKGSGVSASNISSLTVTVGAGGTGGVAAGSGNNGLNSVLEKGSGSGTFSTQTSIGGSGGGSTSATGGSSGGIYGTAGTVGSATVGQGNIGAKGNAGTGTPYAWSGGGGGGGGGVGSPGTNSAGGAGGAGITWIAAFTSTIATSLSLTDTTGYFSGGGGGGICIQNPPGGGSGGNGGSGGGGAGGGGGTPASSGPTGGTGVAGIVNTGGGGGGSGLTQLDNNNNPAGGNGGSGILIVRFITATAPIYTGPNFDTLTAGLTETFTVTGSATSPLTRNFRWQVSTDTGTSWSNASQGSGILTANYVTPTLETTTSGIRYQYRVVVTDSDTAGLFIVDTSTAVYLMINPRNTITSSTGSAIFTQKYGESRTAVFTFAYGTGPRTATVASTTNNQNGRIAWSNLNSDSATVRVGTALPVGTYSETLTVTDSVTAFTTQALTITVSKADTITVTTTLSTSSVTYTESPANVTVTQTVTGLVNSETATVTSTYTANSCEYGGTCVIGNVAPGGGYVFYVSPTVINVATGISSGGIYLATAPQTWSGGSIDPNASWGCGSTNIASTSDSVGSGAENTRLINAGCATAGIASRLAADSSAEGFTDWFIPSIDELTLIYNNLKLNSLSNLQSWNYWSSTQGTTLSYGKYWWFGSGAVSGQTDKNNSAASNMYARPIRAFSPTALASATVPTDAGVYKVGSTFAISSPASLSNYQGVESVTATLTINKARQKTITIGQYLAYPNISSYPLNVYGGSGPGVLTRTLVSAGTAGCSLSASFILTATSVGSCTVKAEKAGTRNYIVESTTATIYWIAWLDNYAAQTLGGNHAIPLAGGNQIVVRTETLTASAFSNETGTAITSARVATKLRINSTGFSGLNVSDVSVTFRPYEDAVVSAVTSTYVEVVIPSGAVTGVIAIDSPRGVAYTQSFTISP